MSQATETAFFAIHPSGGGDPLNDRVNPGTIDAQSGHFRREVVIQSAGDGAPNESHADHACAVGTTHCEQSTNGWAVMSVVFPHEGVCLDNGARYNFNH